MKFAPASADWTDPNGVVDPYVAYSPSYELLKMANLQLQANTSGIGASELIPIFKSYYDQYENVLQYGVPFGDSVQGF